MKTRLYKDSRNKPIMDSTIDLTPELRLTIYTYKNCNGVVTTRASVGHIKEHVITHKMYEDFSLNLNSVSYPRVTAKMIESQHNGTDFDDIIKKAKLFYNL